MPGLIYILLSHKPGLHKICKTRRSGNITIPVAVPVEHTECTLFVSIVYINVGVRV